MPFLRPGCSSFTMRQLAWPGLRFSQRKAQGTLTPNLQSPPCTRQWRLYSEQTAPQTYLPPSRLRRLITLSALSIAFTSLGFLLATAPAIAALTALANAPTDHDSLSKFLPADAHAAEVDAYIQNHPLTKALRANPNFKESRPHLRIVEPHRKHSLTAGTLMGHGKMPVPPLMFSHDGKELVSISYLGTDLCGHVGIIHGGMLATLLDEGLARCSFMALPNKIGVTAQLTVNYRKPAPAGRFMVLRAELVKVEGRKAWVKGNISLLGEGTEMGEVLVEAEGLFVEPKYAKSLPKIFKDQ